MRSWEISGKKCRKLLQRFGLGVFITLLAVVLSYTNFDRVEAVSPTKNVSELVQAGKQRYQAGQFADAAAFWEQAVQILADTRDAGLNYGVVLSNLGLAYQQLGKFTEATQIIDKSINLLNNQDLKKSSSQNVLAEALNIQGSLRLSAGQAQEALSSWVDARKIYAKAGNKAGEIRSLLNQTQALKVLGLHPRILTTLEQVNQTLASQPNSVLKAAALLNLGETLRVMGNLKKSQEVLQQSLNLAQKVNSQNDITLALLSLGNTERSLKQPDIALKYYQEAINTSTSPSVKLQAELNQFRLLIETQKFSEATLLISQIKPLLESLPNSRTTIYAKVNFVESWQKLETGKSTKENKTKAEILAAAVQQARSIKDQRAESYALGYLGELYEENQQWTEAQNLTEKALILAQASNAPDIAYRWEWQLGRLLKNSGDNDAAITAYNEAVKSLAYIRNDLTSSNLDIQFSFRESVEPVYRELVSLLLQGGENKQNKSEVSQTNIKKARDVIESLQLAELDNYFQEACLTNRTAQIDQLDPTAAVIYPIILSDRLEVIVSVKNQPLRHYTSHISQIELESMLEKMRKYLKRPIAKKETLALGSQLYNLLIRPAEPELQTSNIKTLAFVLDGVMKNVSMAALYDGDRYLVEKYSIAITPGLQLLAPRQIKRQKLKVLVGGLSESRQEFEALPGVELEIKEIKSEISAQVLFNQNFTLEAVQKKIRATAYPLVHLATHGQFSSNPEDTFVLTWDSRINVKDFGELLVSRSDDTQTPIELLVLSACKTADGDKRAPLGLAGVAVRSGARSTVATLWSVNDAATSAFMTQFYQQIAQSQVTKAEAMQRAQLTLLKNPEFKHPYYWAPFILVGNWL